MAVGAISSGLLLIQPNATMAPTTQGCDLRQKQCFMEALKEEVILSSKRCSFKDFQKILRGENRSLDYSARRNNPNGTTDYGYFQINSIWTEEFNRLGYYYNFQNNILDNIRAAITICNLRGSREWISMR